MAIGRPTDLTPEIQEQICADVAKGLPKEKVCWAAGISEQTLYRWIEWGTGDESKEPYRSFCEALKNAEVAFLRDVRDKVTTEPKDWTRWAWLGERLQPQVFGKMDRAQIEIRDGRAGGVIIPGKSE